MELWCSAALPIIFYWPVVCWSAVLSFDILNNSFGKNCLAKLIQSHTYFQGELPLQVLEFRWMICFWTHRFQHSVKNPSKPFECWCGQPWNLELFFINLAHNPTIGLNQRKLKPWIEFSSIPVHKVGTTSLLPKRQNDEK